MRISIHACERLLERALGHEEPFSEHLIEYATKLLKTAVGNNHKTLPDGSYPLPDFPGFRYIVKNGTIVTVKDEKRAPRICGGRLKSNNKLRKRYGRK